MSWLPHPIFRVTKQTVGHDDFFFTGGRVAVETLSLRLWRFIGLKAQKNFCAYQPFRVCVCWVSIVASRIFICHVWTLSCCIWGLVPQPGTEPRTPALGARSLSCWATRLTTFKRTSKNYHCHSGNEVSAIQSMLTLTNKLKVTKHSSSFSFLRPDSCTFLWKCGSNFELPSLSEVPLISLHFHLCSFCYLAVWSLYVTHANPLAFGGSCE